MYPLGDQEPKFQMNTFNEITFSNKLSLRFLIHWKYKGDNINLTNLLNDFGGTSADYDADAMVIMYLMVSTGLINFLAAVQEDLLRMQVTYVSGK